MPTQVRNASVLQIEKLGAYYRLRVVAPAIAEAVRPGHFVAFAVGGADGGLLLRRAFSVYAVGGGGSAGGGTVDVIFSVSGAGTRWLAERRPGDRLDVVGPLGRPFPLPVEPARCVLVGGGYGAAPLFLLTAALRKRNCRVDMVLGAATESRLFGALDAKRVSDTAAIATDDGSAGVHGRVTDALDPYLERADVVYACGPMPMLAAVTKRALAEGIPTHVAVEEAMACGLGVCMTCVLPVRGSDGVPHMVRSCVEGPVFPGDRVMFDDVGTIPAGAV
ncbi:MAG: dihydroorotate dehydrogenase electron transfer subunit [Frankiaceae bacterium]|nr:dihydroorotate dehydrogenase electron transfer subunit [Frankiaceae bacterium]